MEKVYNIKPGRPTTVEIMSWEKEGIVVECVKAQTVCVGGIIWYDAENIDSNQVREFIEEIRKYWARKCLIMDIDIPTSHGRRKNRYLSFQLWYKLEKPVSIRSEFVPYLDQYFEIGEEFLSYFIERATDFGIRLSTCPKHP